MKFRTLPMFFKFYGGAPHVVEICIGVMYCPQMMSVFSFVLRGAPYAAQAFNFVTWFYAAHMFIYAYDGGYHVAHVFRSWLRWFP